MTLVEYLTLIQTIILFLTGLVVLWYTYETQKIRRETAKQNSLLAEQLNLVKDSNIYQMKKEKSFLRPIFVCEGGSHSLKHTKLRMRNDGGYISKLSFDTNDNVIIKFQNNFINTNSKFDLNLIDINPNENDEIEFKLNYVDKLGTKGFTSFVYNVKTNVLTEKQV